MDIVKWLQESPKPEEVFYLDEKHQTGKYIPYEIIVEKLYQLCSHEWSAYNLRVAYFNLTNRKTLVTATIEVEVNYEIKGKKIKRILPGAANFVVNGTTIPYTTASAKSLAIMNGVKPLGKQMGWQLNEGEDNANPYAGLIDNELKPEMDMIILSKYKKAVKDGDTLTINNIKAQFNVED